MCHATVATKSISLGEEDDQVSYFRWDRITEFRVIKGKMKDITFIQKAVIETTKHGLAHNFNH